MELRCVGFLKDVKTLRPAVHGGILALALSVVLGLALSFAGCGQSAPAPSPAAFTTQQSGQGAITATSTIATPSTLIVKVPADQLLPNVNSFPNGWYRSPPTSFGLASPPTTATIDFDIEPTIEAAQAKWATTKQDYTTRSETDPSVGRPLTDPKIGDQSFKTHFEYLLFVKEELWFRRKNVVVHVVYQRNGVENQGFGSDSIAKLVDEKIRQAPVS